MTKTKEFWMRQLQESCSTLLLSYRSFLLRHLKAHCNIHYSSHAHKFFDTSKKTFSNTCTNKKHVTTLRFAWIWCEEDEMEGGIYVDFYLKSLHTESKHFKACETWISVEGSLSLFIANSMWNRQPDDEQIYSLHNLINICFEGIFLLNFNGV